MYYCFISKNAAKMIFDKKFAKEISEELLTINAVVLRPSEPFTWASGWNSPIYCDNRLTLRYPHIRKKISKAFVDIIDTQFGDVDVITGTATAGIPHAAWIAQNLDKPLAYVRSTAKSYGMGNQIEGGVDKGQSTIVVEDLISTGGSVLSVVHALKFIGANVKGVMSIFTYGFDKAIENLKNEDLDLYSLTDYATLIDVALEMGKIQSSDIELLNDWRKSPDTWPN